MKNWPNCHNSNVVLATEVLKAFGFFTLHFSLRKCSFNYSNYRETEASPRGICYGAAGCQRAVCAAANLFPCDNMVWCALLFAHCFALVKTKASPRGGLVGLSLSCQQRIQIFEVFFKFIGVEAVKEGVFV